MAFPLVCDYRKNPWRIDTDRGTDANWGALALAIVSKNYCTPERAMAKILQPDNPNPFWITQSVVDEMRYFRSQGMLLRDIGYMYGLTGSAVNKYLMGKRMPCKRIPKSF